MKLIGYRRNSRKRRSPDRTRAHVVDSSGRCPRLAAVAREILVEIHDPSAYLLPSDGPPRVKSTAKMILPDLACGWGVSAAWQSVVACRWNVSSVGSVQTVPKRRQRRIMIHDGGGGGGEGQMVFGMKSSERSVPAKMLPILTKVACDLPTWRWRLEKQNCSFLCSAQSASGKDQLRDRRIDITANAKFATAAHDPTIDVLDLRGSSLSHILPHAA